MKKAVLFIGFSWTVLLAHAQTGLFIMSSVGAMPGTASNGLAIQFNSIATCIDVQTGLAVLNSTRGNGLFAMNCEVNTKFNSLGIKMYPNPVNSTTKVKLMNAPPMSEYFNLSIWTTEGMLVRTQKETAYNLFLGLTIDLHRLIEGTYVLRIESPTYIDAIKFIKTN